MSIYVCIYIHICICIHVCLYIYIYIYIYIHTCVYIYIYIYIPHNSSHSNTKHEGPIRVRPISLLTLRLRGGVSAGQKRGFKRSPRGRET